MAIVMIIGSCLLFPKASFAYESAICTGGGDKCVASEVGPFMQGISKACGNAGTCSLDDIMEVVGNVGNYVAGMVGAVVLLMYTIGGLYYLTAAGDSHRVDKGKSYIKISTVGLLIVFFAYVGINTVASVLRGGSVGSSPDSVICTGKANGTSCGDESVCRNEACTPSCNLTPGRECLNYSPDAGNESDFRGCVQSGCPDQGFCCDAAQNRSLPGDAPANVSLP